MGTIINKFWWIILLLLSFVSFECELERKKSIRADLKNKIVFLCSDGICTINSDGTDLKVIVPTAEGGPFSDVRWSPDKRRIGFTGHVDGQKRIFLADSEGSHKRVISSPHNLQFLGWSSSGKYILCNHLNILDGGLFEVTTTRGKRIARLGGSHPTVGGSDKLVYASSYGGAVYKGTDIFVYDLDSGQKQSVTDTRRKEFAIFYPQISEDGTMITYLRYAHPREVELWVMHSDGSGKKKLATSGKDFSGNGVKKFSFSPAGDKIMFVSTEGIAGKLYIINTDGTELRAITDRIVKATAGASWCPDGSQIVFTSGMDGNDELYVTYVDGTGLSRLTNNSTMDCCPDW